MNKRKLLTVSFAIFCVLLCVTAVLIVYACSPLHPKNISDETVVRNGTEYTVKLKGVSEYDDNGFTIATDGFYYYKNETLYVYRDEEGYARTSFDEKGETYVKGKYNSPFVSYENFAFCSENYKNKQELEAFFNLPDRIYNFDINNLSEYISDIVSYKKQFTGKATVRIYKGRCVITDFYIGDEKVMTLIDKE